MPGARGRGAGWTDSLRRESFNIRAGSRSHAAETEDGEAGPTEAAQQPAGCVRGVSVLSRTLAAYAGSGRSDSAHHRIASHIRRGSAGTLATHNDSLAALEARAVVVDGALRFFHKGTCFTPHHLVNTFAATCAEIR